MPAAVALPAGPSPACHHPTAMSLCSVQSSASLPGEELHFFMAHLLSADFHFADSVPCKYELNKAKLCCCTQALSALGGLGSQLHVLHNCKTKTSAFHTHACHILSALRISTCLKITLLVSCFCSQTVAGAQRHAVSSGVSGLERSLIPMHCLAQTSLSLCDRNSEQQLEPSSCPELQGRRFVMRCDVCKPSWCSGRF